LYAEKTPQSRPRFIHHIVNSGDKPDETAARWRFDTRLPLCDDAEAATVRNKHSGADSMAAYVIADITVQDPGRYDEYRRQVLATIEKYGGRFLVRGGAHQSLEGDWNPGRIVLLEFPDMAALKRWYESEEYGPLITLRQSAAAGSLIAVEGI
jgi:uncharacterized protein (DUF1330 family)